MATEKIINVQQPQRALFSPLWSAHLMRRRFMSGKAILSEAGREVLCSGCGEYWPADTEFFYSYWSAPSGLASWCKACSESAKRRARK